MTVKELVAELQALTPEQQELPVLVKDTDYGVYVANGHVTPDVVDEWDDTVGVLIN